MTTVSPITNIVQNIGGTARRIVGIVPEGTNSHTFEPAPSDAAVLAGRRHRVHERPAPRGAHARARRDEPADGASDRAPRRPRRYGRDEWIFDSSFPEAEGLPNPHLWTNPPYARAVRRDRRRASSRSSTPTTRRPTQRTRRVRRRGSASSTRSARTVTRTVPPENRKLLTYHDSFPYFAREYGWEMIGAIQPSDFSEPTPQERRRPDRPDREAAGSPRSSVPRCSPAPRSSRSRAETGADLRGRSARRRSAWGGTAMPITATSG